MQHASMEHTAYNMLACNMHAIARARAHPVHAMSRRAGARRPSSAMADGATDGSLQRMSRSARSSGCNRDSLRMGAAPPPADHSGGQCALSTQWECGQSLTSSSSYVQWTQHLRQSQSLVPLTYVGSAHRVTSYSCQGTCGGQWGERTLLGTAEWPGLAWRGPARRRAAQPSCARSGGCAAPARREATR